MTTDDKGARGITFFDPPAGAPDLMDTGVMSMPVADPPADDQFMGWALSGGHMTKVLFRQGGDDGMSLVWSWFAPGFPLPRHSHSADCLYYVVSGEAHLGNRTVGAGGGFFVPADAPYAYTAGPEGIQILEFRGVSTFDMQITERLPRWDKILETVHDKQESWQEAAAGVL
jgi:quercetin dioxygenase-like cupin family protein